MNGQDDRPPQDEPNPPYPPPAAGASGPPGAPPPGAGPLPYAPAMEMDPQARQWGMLAHLVALAGFVFGPLGIIIGPLIVWLMKKDQYSFVNSQGKEALNFQITPSMPSRPRC